MPTSWSTALIAALPPRKRLQPKFSGAASWKTQCAYPIKRSSSLFAGATRAIRGHIILKQADAARSGRVNEVLEQHKLDQRLEHLCRRFYKPVFGRPSLAPEVYFRLLLIGFFEGIDSERGIAWRVADSLSLREFIGYSVTEQTPDHSTISRTRRLLPVETHRAVFRWFVRVLGEEGLLEGQTIAIDATTLEANAAMRSIRRRDDGRRYEEYLKDLAQAEGLENPTREQLARLDRKRKKKGSNQEWMSPADPDARITKMKDGRTHRTKPSMPWIGRVGCGGGNAASGRSGRHDDDATNAEGSAGPRGVGE